MSDKNTSHAIDPEVSQRRCGWVSNDPRQRRVPCTRPAGDGTDHPGIGYCSYHDNKAPGGFGKYLPLVRLVDPEMRPLVLRILSSDEEIFNLRFELATLKAKYAMEWQDMSITNVVKMVRTISGAIKTLYEMEQGKHYYVHVNVLALVLESVGQVARQYLPEDKRDQFSEDLQSAMARMLPKTTRTSIATTALATPIDAGLDDKPAPVPVPSVAVPDVDVAENMDDQNAA